MLYYELLTLKAVGLFSLDFSLTFTLYGSDSIHVCDSQNLYSDHIVTKIQGAFRHRIVPGI